MVWRGSFQQSRTGNFVQGITGDRNNAEALDVLSIILYDEVTSACDPITGYIMPPVCTDLGMTAWDEDVVRHNALREGRTVQVAIVNRQFTDDRFFPNRPDGKALPEGVTEFRVAHSPSTSQLVSVYDAMRPLMERPFLVMVSHASEFPGITDLIGFRPAINAFVGHLRDQRDTDELLSKVRGYVDFFDGIWERWLQITPHRIRDNV